MNQLTLKRIVGLGLVVGHFSVIVTVVVLWARGGYSFDEFTTTLVLLSPIFAVYTTAVIAFLLEDRSRLAASDERVNAPYVFITLFVPALFLGLMFVCVWFKAYNVAFSSFEQFKICVGAIQSAFGLYVGQVVGSLYDIRGTAPRPSGRVGRVRS